MFALAMVVFPLFQAIAQTPAASPWQLAGSNPSRYVMAAAGSATDEKGATLTLRSITEGSGFGTVTAIIPADTLRNHRVRLSAEIEAQAISGSASVWIRVDSGSQTLALDNGADQGVRGTTGARHMDVELYVPRSATRLVFGLLVSGTGTATAHDVRLVARPVADTNGGIGPEAGRVLDSAFAIVRRASLWRDTVTWSRVEPEVRRIAAGAESAADVYPALRTLLARLGDRHSFFLRPQGAQSFRTGGAENPKPVVRVYRPGVGYVSVPGYSGGDQSAALAYARSMQESLAQAAADGAGTCRWIVDLRSNGGGNMWPMLGGLRPFLGEEGLGSFVNPGASTRPWHARDQVNVAVSPGLVPLESANVAVLTGPRTASSGEAVTISFRGRPRTRSFGLATAGVSTANTAFRLPDGSLMFLTTAVEADRTGRKYGEKIEPDEKIDATLSTATEDAQIARALAWLEAQDCER
jgi:C-terminal processing protease CtpA/Prc